MHKLYKLPVMSPTNCTIFLHYSAINCFFLQKESVGISLYTKLCSWLKITNFHFKPPFYNTNFLQFQNQHLRTVGRPPSPRETIRKSPRIRPEIRRAKDDNARRPKRLFLLPPNHPTQSRFLR